MGALAARIAQGLAGALPRSWTADREAPLLPAELAVRLGFRTHADLLLSGPAGERIVVEIEISRADPIANPAKYFLAMHTRALTPVHGFAGMVSSHVDAGRRNQSALFVQALRTQGFDAFQVALLPHVAPARVRELNHLEPQLLEGLKLPYRRELDRILGTLRPIGEREHRIHFAGDPADVLANLWAWNDEIAGTGADIWTRRRVQFFVHDPRSRTFAPSKFCAFLPARRPKGPTPPATMTMAIYAQLGERDPRFDGHVARRHLVSRLAFEETTLAERLEVATAFRPWHQRVERHVQLREPVRILTPPAWYR